MILLAIGVGVVAWLLTMLYYRDKQKKNRDLINYYKSTDNYRLTDELDKLKTVHVKTLTKVDELTKDLKVHLKRGVQKRGVASIEYTFTVKEYGVIFEKTIPFSLEVIEVEKTETKSKIKIIGDYDDIRSEVTTHSSLKNRVYLSYDNDWIDTNEIEFYESNTIT